MTLSEQVQALHGPDRAVDREVWLACIADGQQKATIATGFRLSDSEGDFRTDYMMDGFNPTASVDTVLTILPEGFFVGFVNAGGAETTKPIPGKASAWCAPFDNIADLQLFEAATPALALLAAVLKARGL